MNTTIELRDRLKETVETHWILVVGRNWWKYFWTFMRTKKNKKNLSSRNKILKPILSHKMKMWSGYVWWQAIFMESHLNFRSNRLNLVSFDFKMPDFYCCCCRGNCCGLIKHVVFFRPYRVKHKTLATTEGATTSHLGWFKASQKTSHSVENINYALWKLMLRLHNIFLLNPVV